MLLEKASSQEARTHFGYVSHISQSCTAYCPTSNEGCFTYFDQSHSWFWWDAKVVASYSVIAIRGLWTFLEMYTREWD